MSEHRAIGSFAKQFKRVNDLNSSVADVYSVTKYDGFVRSLDYFKKQVFSRDLSSYNIVKKGEFAYSTIHLDEGALGLLNDEEALISPMYTTFEVDESVDRRYLAYLLKSPNLINQYGLIGQGSVNRRKSVPFSSLAELKVFIPPLLEQKKIAEILSGIDTAINKIAKAIVKSDTALTGIFAELDLIAAAGKISTLGETARVQNGYAFQSSIFTEDPADIPLVRISNISGGIVDTSKSKRIPQTLAALGEYKVRRGDILIAMSGATTGKIGIYHGSSFCMLNQRVGKFVFHPGNKSIAYATQLLLSGFLESRILAKAAGGAQPNISGKGIEAIEIPFPDTADQDKYAIAIQEFLRVNAKRRLLVEKYQHLKSALSSDLLSGRKRVNV